MIDEIKKIINAFNNSFELEPEITEVDGEEVLTNLKIKNIKNDCSDFVIQLFDMLSIVVENSSEYELVYNKEGQFELAKKVLKETYIESD